MSSGQSAYMIFKTSFPDLPDKINCNLYHLMSKFGCSNAPYHKMSKCLENASNDFEKCKKNISDQKL